MRLLPVLFIAATLAALPRAAAPEPPLVPPRPARYVTDRTGRLPPARVAALNEKLAAFERQTSTQVLVYVDSRVPANTTLDEFANLAFREWGIGQKGKDNGVLFVAFLDDRVMRLEVGYGLEGVIPDARAKQITSDVVKPRFKAGDYAGGIEAAADQIMAAARGEPYRGTGRTVAEDNSVPLGFKLVAGFFLSVIAGTILYGLRNAWRDPDLRTASPVARWSARAAAVCWTIVVLSPMVFVWFGRLPPLPLALALAELGLLCGAVAIAVKDAGFRRVLGIAGRVAFMGAVALAPRAWDIVGTGRGDHRLLYVLGGCVFVGLWSVSRRDSGSYHWSSSSSASSSSSSSGSSSSGFSGGGGSSGGGGASDSW